MHRTSIRGTRQGAVKGGWRLTLMLLSFCLASASCGEPLPEAEPGPDQVVLTVTASAYNSLYGQGAGKDHALAAWGDRLEPGMKAIAVSRDLIRQGLDHNTAVTIDGLPGTWYVKDKMHRRWRNKIDLYMGEDREAALEWGVQEVTIRFTPKK